MSGINDSLIFATCHIYNIKYLVSFDSDFRKICDKEEMILINAAGKFKEIEIQ
jgi:predicted nucleic acid-binding protein